MTSFFFIIYFTLINNYFKQQTGICLLCISFVFHIRFLYAQNINIAVLAVIKDFHKEQIMPLQCDCPFWWNLKKLHDIKSESYMSLEGIHTYSNMSCRSIQKSFNFNESFQPRVMLSLLGAIFSLIRWFLKFGHYKSCAWGCEITKYFLVRQCNHVI